MSAPSVGDLLVRTFELYRRNFVLVMALTAPIVLVVSGITALGLGIVGAHYRPGPPLRDGYVELAASALVTVPLVYTMLAKLVVHSVAGERASASELLASSLEAFPFVLLVYVIWLAAVFLGSLLVVPGIYLLVSWYFVVQAVVVDGQRGLAAIQRSATLVRGNWFRSASTGVVFALIAAVFVALVVPIFQSLAESSNNYVLIVVGNAIVNVLTLPFLAIGATLYYLWLRESAGAVRRY